MTSMADKVFAGVSLAQRLWSEVHERLDFDARRREADFRNLRARFYLEYWSNAAQAIGAEIEELGYGFLKIRRDGKSTIVRGYSVQLDNHITLQLAGNKTLTYHLLSKHGHPTPRFLQFKLADLAPAEYFLAELDGPAVIKPASDTGGGKGITMHIDSLGKLRKAAHMAAMQCPDLLVEEQLRGNSYRLLYLNGKFVDAVRRDPPRVTGDGVGNIKSLVCAENKHRLNGQKITALSPLTMDLESKLTLLEQGFDMNTIPPAQSQVLVKTVVNQNTSQENHCVRDEVHPSIVKAGQEIVTQFGIELGGIDLLTADITVPLEESKAVINEVNTTPGLHHHALVAEERARLPIAEMILDYIFSRNS